MIYSSQFVSDVKKATEMLDQMINSAESQGAKNLDIAYSLRKGLSELSNHIEANTKPDFEFMNKWQSVMAWCSRFFEGHPILDLIYRINNEISRGGAR